jgi:hypothetical protein
MKNLYKVTLKGMHGGFCSRAHGIAYVVADNPSAAVDKVQKHLIDADIGTTADRALQSIELLAEEYDYADCGFKLYL